MHAGQADANVVEVHEAAISLDLGVADSCRCGRLPGRPNVDPVTGESLRADRAWPFAMVTCAACGSAMVLDAPAQTFGAAWRTATLCGSVDGAAVVVLPVHEVQGLFTMSMVEDSHALHERLTRSARTPVRWACDDVWPVMTQVHGANVGRCMCFRTWADNTVFLVLGDGTLQSWTPTWT